MKSSVNLYIKTMYMLEINIGKIRVTDIAEKLSYTKSSVSKALVRLSKNGYIEYKSYGDILLTEKAKTIAQEILLKENIIELFFVGILDVNEDQAKKDINVISEYVSDETKNKLKNYIKKYLRFNDSHCNGNNPKCKNCEINNIKNKVSNNEKWLNILKEEE